MASIRKEISIEASPEYVWDALRDYGGVHQRLAPGFVVDARLDGDDRIVTFNGMVMKELLVGIDDERRRLAYAAVGPQLTHHNGSAQVVADGAGGTRLVWIIDVLPNALAAVIDGMMERGAAVIKETLEPQTVPR